VFNSSQKANSRGAAFEVLAEDTGFRPGTWNEISLYFVDRARRIPNTYEGAENSLDRPRRKQATTTEDFEFHISYL